MYAIQYADLPRFAEMQKDLAKAEIFRDKADAWWKQHGMKYDLETCEALLLLAWFLGPLVIPLAALLVIKRGNPHNGAASFYYARAQKTRAAIAKANNWPEASGRKAQRPATVTTKASAATPARLSLKARRRPRTTLAL